MNRDVSKNLVDILESIKAIENYLGEKRIYDQFKKSQLLQDAVIRRLEIIGEATNRILKITPEISISNSRRIVGLRNKISHEYDAVSIENIWAVIVNHLPVLKNEIEDLLENNELKDIN